MTSRLDAALDYAINRGWPIFPCRVDKKPYNLHGVLEATTNPEQIKIWWERWPRANIGLNVGEARLMVVDLDPGHSMEELEANVGPLPETNLVASTPRGGKHLFYELAEDDIVPASASKVAHHVDIRSFHSYVLLAPSATSDGEYTWTDAGRPSFRSDRLVEAAAAAQRDKSVDADNWIIDRDLPENIDAAATWLKHDARPSIEGQGGDNNAYATAAMMKSYGLSPEMALELMLEHWNPRCEPPWRGDEVDQLVTKVENGYSYNTSPPGNMTAAYKETRKREMFAPVASRDLDSGKEFTAGRFRAVDREGMKSIRPPKWIIDGLIPEDTYALMYGAWGTFKTFVALDIALSIATGFPADPNWTIIQPGPVLYVAGEGRAGIRKRVQGWEKQHWYGNEVKDFVLADPVPLVSEEREGFYEAVLAHHRNYRLVILDTVGRSMQGLNENAQENASSFTALIQEIQYNLGCTVLALHHTGHDGKRARGSSVFGADADVVIKLDREGKSYHVELINEKQKDAEPAKTLRISLDEIPLSAETKTLVAMPFNGPPAQATSEQKDEETTAVDILRLDLLEQVGLEFLRGTLNKVWSGGKLADAIATDDRISISGKSISNRWLRVLREDNKREISKCYHPVTGQWKMDT